MIFSFVDDRKNEEGGAVILKREDKNEIAILWRSV